MLSRLSIASRLGLLICLFAGDCRPGGCAVAGKWHSLSRLQASGQLLQVAGKASGLIHRYRQNGA
jgi:hypothetical protein